MWRRNRDMAITVRGDVVDGVQAPDVTNQIWPKLQQIRDSLEPAYRIEAGGAFEESAKGNASIFVLFPLMVLVMLTLLMIQLQSFSRLFLVFLTAPLGIVGASLGLNPQLPNEAFAEIVIVAKNVEARERIKDKIENAVADGALPEARVRVDRFNFGPPVGFPVQFRVIGPDANKVRDIAYQVRDVMRQNPNAREPQLDWNEQSP